jgi:hypothetical protein
MSIVQHCTPFSYSLLPPYPLLAAPAPRLMLPAPQISGLICAPQAKVVENIVVEKYTALDLILEEVGPIPTIEEMDAEIEQLWAEGRQRQRILREALEARLVAKRHQREQARQERLKQ